MKRLVYGVGVLASLGLMGGALLGRLPLNPMVVFGFITGGWCVWLTVEQNVWTWPIGITNSAAFLILFVQARLFADGSLQAVYIVLGALGWYWWLRGGASNTTLAVSRTSSGTALILAGLLIGCTAALTVALVWVHDAAPFWDALTTVLSLIAQYMLTRKMYENWWLWISADMIYVVLYASKGLPLTAVLYAVFLLMCVAGLRQWRVALGAPVARLTVVPVVPWAVTDGSEAPHVAV